MHGHTRTLKLTVDADDERHADQKVQRIISAIDDSDALPTGVVAEQPTVNEDFRDDMGDMALADHVEVRWTARDERGRVLFNSDDVLSAEQAVGMFRGIGEVTP